MRGHRSGQPRARRAVHGRHDAHSARILGRPARARAGLHCTMSRRADGAGAAANFRSCARRERDRLFPIGAQAGWHAAPVEGYFVGTRFTV